MNEPAAGTVDPSASPSSDCSKAQHASPFFLRPSKTWTDSLPQDEHTAIVVGCDYAATSLGPIEDWGPALRLYVSMALADSRGTCIYYGPDRVAVYNKPYSLVIGQGHPSSMGRSFFETFPELAQVVEPAFQQVIATGKTFDVENMLLFPEVRNGYPEETYFIGQYIPLRGDSGEIEGIYNTTLETTARVLYERRRQVVEYIAALPPFPVNETLSMVVKALHLNPHDIPAALLYSWDELAPEGHPNLLLRGSVGYPKDHRCAPVEAHLETGQDALIPFFRHVKSSGKPLVLSRQQCEGLFEAVDWCGYGEESREIVISPLSTSGQTLGFYVQGTNPRRPYDDAMARSITEVTMQIEVKWIASISTQQAQLREQVLERRATDTENRLRHTAQSAPLGMLQIGRDHKIMWANDQFYEITGHDRSKPDMAHFFQNIVAEEREPCARLLEGLVSGAHSRIEREIRLEREWIPPGVEDGDSEPVSAWMLASCFPLMENGEVKLLQAYATDISHQKWAENIQTRNANAAVLAKRRQEEFIDVTSHEMRNPLSAITQLADGIANSIQIEHEDGLGFWRDTARESAAAASTILACAAHQKRIIDDVLILSRLDSHMLSITPVVAQPTSVVSNTIKMFDGEVAMSGIEIVGAEDDSYGSLAEDYCLIDTSRLTQILINLISNAIKFTASRPVRKITVVLGQQAVRPPQLTTEFGDLHWMPRKDPGRWATVLPELVGGEETLYLYFCVQDTGPGLTTEEMERLFKRFSQATTRTHIAYGGSGLGLYVCRELAEKQGGGVGVSSRKNEGSVFAFYIETRRSPNPERQDERKSSIPAGTLPIASDTPGLPRLATSEPRRVRARTPLQKAPTASSPPIPEMSPTPNLSPSLPQRQGSYHVLLVEDNIVNQKVLAKQLRKANCIVTVANHGEEALEIIRKADCWREKHAPNLEAGGVPGTLRIDVILMDVEMPILDGLECTRRIRAWEAEGQLTKHFQIIATTANVRAEQKDRALAAGVDSVLSKPFTVAEVMTRIAVSLEEPDSPRKEP